MLVIMKKLIILISSSLVKIFMCPHNLHFHSRKEKYQVHDLESLFKFTMQ
jgi:hypothetical protein